MKEDQFEHIENRIREALENNQPAFEEASWDKMALLLAKEKKRRFPLWWFLFPIIIGGAAVFYFTPGLKRDRASVDAPTVQSSRGLASNNIIQNGDHLSTETRNKPTAPGHPAEADIHNSFPEQTQPPLPGKVRRIENTTIIPIREAPEPDHTNDDPKQTFTRNNKTTVKISTPNPNEAGNEIGKTDLAETSNQVAPVDAELNTLAEAPIKVIPNTSSDSLKSLPKRPTTNPVVKKPAKKQPGNHGFYLMAVAGIDNSSVKFLSFKNSDPAFQYGLGVGIDLSSRMAIQTGFLASHKKYVAGPGDYNPKAGSYLSMVDIRKVDANCLVYEIPVSVKYNFYRGSGLNVFGTAGASSYIMKREDYNYEYLRNNTLNYTSWTYKGNRHLFSVLNFSAGVEKKINHEFSVLAAPAVYIPLHGVGDGKVKLYSAALQVSLKYNPAKKSKRGK